MDVQRKKKKRKYEIQFLQRGNLVMRGSSRLHEAEVQMEELCLGCAHTHKHKYTRGSWRILRQPCCKSDRIVRQKSPVLQGRGAAGGGWSGGHRGPNGLTGREGVGGGGLLLALACWQCQGGSTVGECLWEIMRLRI